MYYPKSQIQTDLYTKGEQLQLVSSKEEYIGYYWKTSKNEYFTGRNPQDGSPLKLELIPVALPSTLSTITIEQNNKVYNTLKNIDTSKTLLVPLYYKPSPTQEDYEIGYFTRYFAKKQNQNLYIEVNKDTFNKLKTKNESYDYKSYLNFELNWQISGNKDKVQQTNKKIIFSTEKRLRIEGLTSYLNFNYLEFYK